MQKHQRVLIDIMAYVGLHLSRYTAYILSSLKMTAVGTVSDEPGISAGNPSYVISHMGIPYSAFIGTKAQYSGGISGNAARIGGRRYGIKTVQLTKIQPYGKLQIL